MVLTRASHGRCVPAAAAGTAGAAVGPVQPQRELAVHASVKRGGVGGV